MPPLIFVSNEALHSKILKTILFEIHPGIAAHSCTFFIAWKLLQIKATKQENTGKTYSRDRGRGCHDCDIHEVLKCGDVTNS